MVAETSDGLRLELHGFLAERLASLGRRRGTRTLVEVPLQSSDCVLSVLKRLVASDERYALLFEEHRERLPEHVEVVLNDRVLDLQGGLAASLKSGDVLVFLPAHAGG
jgi:molybdopterin converting factor small subunit